MLTNEYSKFTAERTALSKPAIGERLISFPIWLNDSDPLITPNLLPKDETTTPGRDGVLWSPSDEVPSDIR